MGASIHKLSEQADRKFLAEIWRRHALGDFEGFEQQKRVFVVDGGAHVMLARDRSERLALANRRLALQTLVAHEFPVPRILAHEEDAVDETSLLVTRQMEGEPLERAWADLSLAKRDHLARSAGELLARLHAVCRFPYFGGLGRLAKGHGYPRWNEAFREVLRYQCDMARARGMITQKEEARIAESMAHVLPHMQATVMGGLVHGGFCFRKVLVQDGEVSGIVGFSHAQSGDPLIDLARADDIERECPGAWRAFMRGYKEDSGLSETAREKLDLYRILYHLGQANMAAKIGFEDDAYKRHIKACRGIMRNM